MAGRPDGSAPREGEGAEKPPFRAPGPEPSLGDLFWIGTACALSVILAGGLGYGLDQWLGTSPWLTFAGLAFGVTSAVLLGWSQFRRFL